MFTAADWHTTNAACARCTRDARLDSDGRLCSACLTALCDACTCPDHPEETPC